MPPALAIAAKDLRLRLRDRSAYVIGFVAPIGLALIISLAFGGDVGEDFRATYALADLDSSELSGAFSEQVLGGEELRERLTIREVGADEAAELVGDGSVSAAFVVPEGFEQGLRDGEPVRLTVLRRGSEDVPGLVAEAIARTFTDRLNAGRLSVLTAVQTGRVDLGRLDELAVEAAQEESPAVLADAFSGGGETSPANYFGPSMAIFFLYFTVGFAGRSLYAEREGGTMARLLASPIGVGSVLTGKALSVVAYGLVSLAVMFGVLGLLLDTPWGDPGAVAALSIATVVAILGVTSLVGALARTGRQAENAGQLVAFGFALAGGSFFPLFQLSDVMQRLSRLTPNGWAIEGFTAVSYDGAGISGILPNLGALAAFAVVSGGAALVFGRRMVRA